MKDGISKEYLTYYDIGARFCGLAISPELLEKLVLTFQGIEKHKGAFSVKHIARINTFIETKYSANVLTLEGEKDGNEDLSREGDTNPHGEVHAWDLHTGQEK